MAADLLIRNDISDIVTAVIQAMPNSNMTVNSPTAGATSQFANEFSRRH